ncbi:3-hydroxybutyryl-CoA dehydrogenase [Tsukamurella pulmonis]|uniref:3-hydroxybutyryl-CoA dehydrogenase n=1 Tax=Tsukamurella pulmonis TaxID=47312 RepID=A0A1H1CK14_9ACTN|nr:3-hydroxyacyl-CoA dehydrogenase [Tsukamurella pulmonis]KXO89865.1 3-hydroxybutyryl-CoA dehydrogenase [Tsukamurella pulmonis]KXP11122.1 3-hydroxybutyryl-CoA dehydrogenase [Tsukamurella pulmonis]RDH10264.1 3-hydroxyacyl-CoA dehydrogenase [Tsukamurella pulmonis]SDQ64565.1 3-hydroxybutyryl-CoA dehydrogenase [Tsukamurella pulmonis]SUP23601.1 3-hydroxybutyryl-CoA dehydrogenase [Tsukamurella pulmonis]
MTDIRRVTVLGTGVLGAQIAFQSAYSGFEVTAYDIDDAALERARATFDSLVETYVAEVDGAADGAAEAARDRLTLTSDLAVAAQEADLIIEAVPEVLELKRETFARLNSLAPETTIFATNSSSLLPSAIADATGRPDRFLALHFANRIWSSNTAEVMGTPATAQAVFDTVVEFAGEIGMVAIPIHKEKAGYVLNSLLIPFLNAGVELAADGYASPQDVDKVWRIGTGSAMGPFQILDIVGLNTPYNIMSAGDERDRDFAAWIKENYLDQGRTGIAAGKGFYDYD